MLASAALYRFSKSIGACRAAGIAAAFGLFACQPARSSSHEPVRSQVSVPVPRVTPPVLPAKPPGQFQFAIVSDRTGGHRGQVFESALAKANLLLPDFVMSVGDLIEGYTTEPAEIAEQWDEFKGFVAQLERPFFYVPGNHDLSNPLMAAAWREQFGQSYYHFVYRDVLFLCLNTEDGAPSTISEAQVEAMRRALSDNPRVRWTLLFMHKPLWNEPETSPGRVGFEHIEASLTDRPYTVFAGHYHNYKKVVRKDRRYIVLATTGGGSEMRGVQHGQFDELAWVTMTDAGPRLANLLLDGILDEDVRTDATAKRVDAAVQGLKVQVDNLQLKSDTFAGGSTRLNVTNETGAAVRFEAELGATAPIQPAPHRIASTLIPAGQRASFPIKLRVDKPVRLTELSGMPVAWSAQVLDAGEPLALRDSTGFGVSRVRDIKRRTRPVVVDGKLDEWEKLRFDSVLHYQRSSKDYPAAPPKPENLSYSFDLAYDDDNVYVAVRVRDDVVVAQATKKPWQQDGIELSLDARDDPERSANRRIYWDAWRTYAYLAVSPPDAEGRSALFDPDRIPKTVRVICVRTPDGYAAEFSFPNAVLNAQRAKGEWNTLRFTLGVHERDAIDGPSTAIWWQPDWHWETNIPGSGTFESTRRN